MSEWERLARRLRVPLGFVLGILCLWLARPRPLTLVVGGCIALAGVMLRAIASGHITKNSKLTTSGPYAFTRNPLYLGSLIIAAGLAMAAWNGWIVLALLAFFLAVYLPVVRSEEAFLRSQFREYEAYARQVPRFVPRLRSRLTSTGSFSRERYLRHREYNALIGTIAMLAALAAKWWWTG